MCEVRLDISKVYDITSEKQIYYMVKGEDKNLDSDKSNIYKFNKQLEIDMIALDRALSLISDLKVKGKSYGFKLDKKSINYSGIADEILGVIGTRADDNNIIIVIDSISRMKSSVVNKNIHKIALNGIKIAVDQFNTASDSIESILELPISIVNIDVKSAIVRNRKESIRAINNINTIKSMGITIGINGIEDKIRFKEHIESINYSSMYASSIEKEKLWTTT